MTQGVNNDRAWVFPGRIPVCSVHLYSCLKITTSSFLLVDLSEMVIGERSSVWNRMQGKWKGYIFVWQWAIHVTWLGKICHNRLCSLYQVKESWIEPQYVFTAKTGWSAHKLEWVWRLRVWEGSEMSSIPATVTLASDEPWKLANLINNSKCLAYHFLKIFTSWSNIYWTMW